MEYEVGTTLLTFAHIYEHVLCRYTFLLQTIIKHQWKRSIAFRT